MIYDFIIHAVVHHPEPCFKGNGGVEVQFIYLFDVFGKTLG